MGGCIDEVLESSLLRRFFFELPSLPSVVDSVFAPNENPGVVAGAIGAVEAAAEVLPKENPGVVAGAVGAVGEVEAVAEVLPKEKVGTLC